MNNIKSSQDICKKCGEQYTDICNKWCKPCQINYLTKKRSFNFTLPKKIFTSGNKEIDNLIREIILKYIECLKTHIQRIIFWFLVLDVLIYIVKNVAKNIQIQMMGGVSHVK